MHKKYAKFDVKNVNKLGYKNVYFDNAEFRGNISLLTMIDSNRTEKFENGVNKEYALTGDKWLEIYPENGDYALICFYDKNDEINEWYFDIANKVDITEEGIPYTEDLYLDVVMKKDGSIHVLDEDELIEAYEINDISKEMLENAYSIKDNIIAKIDGKMEELSSFTKKYLEILKDRV